MNGQAVGGELLGWRADELAHLGATRLGELYRSPAVLAAEERLVLSRSWALVADAADLEAPGDYVTATVGSAPIVVLRDGDGALRAFHNLCRHRGLALLEGSGRVGRYLTCPYHQWSFARDGSLVNVPQQEEQFTGLDRTRWSLVPASVAEWHGMVFCHPSADAPGLHEAMCGVDDRLDTFLSGPLVEVARVGFAAACNWKLLIENHVDVYHLWYLHSRSLQAYAHARFAWEALGPNWWSHEPLKEPESAPARFAWAEEEQRTGIGAHLVFPNLMIVTTGSYFATYDAVPIAPDRTSLTLRVRATPDADAGHLVGAIRSFMAEDVEVCEALQRSTGSPAYGLGPLASSHEEPVRHFHAALRDALLAGAPGA